MNRKLSEKPENALQRDLDLSRKTSEVQNTLKFRLQWQPGMLEAFMMIRGKVTTVVSALLQHNSISGRKRGRKTGKKKKKRGRKRKRNKIKPHAFVRSLGARCSP